MLNVNPGLDSTPSHYRGALSATSWVDWSCRRSPLPYSGWVNEFTHLLARVDQGDPKAAEELLPLVYGELRKLAARKMAHEAAGQTLQPTALVHEAWLRLAGSHDQQWNSRGHFFAAAAEAMRRILIDNARRKHRLRHGQGLARVDLDRVDVAIHSDDDTLIRVDDALRKLAREDAIKAELVKLRFFIGLSIAQAGKALGLSESTAKRYWAYSRAWLYEELKGDSS
jgi:RNA polymerase sigma factor (TIGR02999 family)